MIKTLLRSVLIILVLSGVFFFALRYWEEKKNQSFQPPPVSEVAPKAQEAPSITLTKVEVQAQGDGAVLYFSDVAGPNYRMTSASDGKSLMLELPAEKVNLLQTSIPNPHPLISMVEVIQTPLQGDLSQIKIRIDLNQEVTSKDRMEGRSLYIELSPKGSPLVQSAPVLKSKKSKKKKEKPVRHFASAPNKPKRSPKPAKKSDDNLDDLLGNPAQEAPPPAHEPEPPPPAAAEAPKGGGNDDLGELIGGGAAPLPAEAAPAEAPPPEEKVAALPPKDMGKFDSSHVNQNLPRVTALSIQNEGGVATVRIERDSGVKYRFLKMRNPFRLVVELYGLNALKPEYSGSGGKVQKVTTQQFRGEETITRVMIFVPTQPEYESETDGKTLVVKLP